MVEAGCEETQMSITITTDVFCDGDECGDWEHGVSGSKVKVRAARKQVQRSGWVRVVHDGKLRDLCPRCRQKRRPNK